MNKENNRKQIKKVTENLNNKKFNPQIKDKIKSMIINKYNVSPKHADKLISEIEMNSEKLFNTKNNNFKKDSSFKKNSEHENLNNIETNNIFDKFDILHNTKGEINSKNMTFNKKIENNTVENQESDNKSQHQNISEDDLNMSKMDNIQNYKENLNHEKADSSNNINIDSLLEEIIPNYNQQISIKLEHVDLTFEVQTEKIDNIKEAFINTLLRKKSDKLKIHALNDVSFEIYRGEKVGIIGYNGAGKSTLLNVISGIFPPDKGNVTTYGNISPLLSLGAGFDRNYTGRQNIILNGSVLGYEKEFLESKIDEIIEFTELGKYIDIPIKNYSSGMLAKLGFSIATAVNPDILIIDEILGVGDANFMRKSADKIKSLMDGGTTVLLVSHSIPQIRNLCDIAIWMDNGRVKAIGEVNKICDEYLKDAEKATKEQIANINLV